MSVQADLGRFLSACRARLSPERAGVPVFAGTRRVPGLRREEVAHVAGVSVDYYTRLERGRVSGASDSVLVAVARALQLDDVETQHLFHLVRSLRGTSRDLPSRRAQHGVRPEVERVLDAIAAPAFVQSARFDVVAMNGIARATYSRNAGCEPVPFNLVEFQFLDRAARAFYRDWEATTRHTVAELRAAAAGEPGDESIAALVGRVSEKSDHFGRLWSSTYEVARVRNGSISLRHPTAGDLEFAVEAFDLPADPGLVLVVYSAEPASPTARAVCGFGAEVRRP